MDHQDEYYDNMITMLELIWGEGYMAPGGLGNIERRKFTKDVKIATYFALLIDLSDESFIKKINIDPIRGRKVTADNIGKFI